MSRNCCIFWRYRAILLVLLTVAIGAAPLHAQARLNDHDIEALMKNLREDSKSFRAEFDDAIKKSAIRKTSQEKDARNLVADFEKQADAMLNDFKKTKKGDVAVETTISSAQEVDHLLSSVQLNDKILAQWDKIHTELAAVSNGFGISVPNHYRK